MFENATQVMNLTPPDRIGTTTETENKVGRTLFSPSGRAGMSPEDVRRNFWFGTHYYRAPSPPIREWDEDFARMKEMGLTTIQARVFWRWHERKEGVFFWDDLDRMMDMAAAHGLQVVHQICLENAPQYVFDDLNGFRVDIRGQRIWPIANAAFYVGGWIPCFDHPDVMKYALRFVRVLIERYGVHPALALWHAWNEPRCRPMGECACPHSIRSYREWLRERFGTIDGLNERYGKCWGDFDQVDAARDTADFAEMYLWRQWGADRVRDRVKRVADTIRELDPVHAVISHVGNCSVMQDPLFDISDDERMTDITDLYGASFPVRFEPESTPFMIADWMRNICRGTFSIYELYPSVGGYPEIPPYQVQQWCWAAIAGGARNVFFWQFKKERLGLETNDAGLVETDGSDNSTSIDARRTLNIMTRLAPEIAHWRVPPAPSAIVYDLESDLINRLEGTIPRDGDYTGRYDLRYSFPAGSSYKAALRGVYGLLWERNLQVDIISARRLADEAGRYRLLYLPALGSVDEARAEILYRYMKNGGIVIADAGFARRDSNTWLQPSRPGSGLSRLLGYREKNWTVNPQWHGKIRFGETGTVLDTRFEKVCFQVDTATVCAVWDEDGTPAAVTGNVGRGKFLVLGCLPGISEGETAGRAWARQLETLITDWAGIHDSHWLPRPVPEGVIVRTLLGEKGEKVILAFRRYTDGAAMSEADWAKIRLAETPPWFELSHVKCWRLKEND